MAGRIQMTASTAALVRLDQDLASRVHRRPGEVVVKGKQAMHTFWLFTDNDMKRVGRGCSAGPRFDTATYIPERRSLDNKAQTLQEAGRSSSDPQAIGPSRYKNGQFSSDV